MTVLNNMQSDPIITAVVCTHNRAAFLGKCVRSLLKQTLSRELYEILIVDNGSTDNTREVIAEFAGEPGVRSVFEPVLGLSRARNRGWQEARGEFVGYIDDDATADEKWLESALWSFKNADPKPEWVGGPIDLEWETSAPEWINDELSVPLGKLYWGDQPCWLTSQQRLGGGNSFFKKAVFEEIGGFDETLGRKPGGLLSGEETELQERFRDRGKGLYYHPGVNIRHFVSAERCRPAWFYRRYYWGGRSDAIMFRSLTKRNVSPSLQGNTVDERDAGGSRLKRITRNVWCSLGILTPRNKRIRARIYMSYALGRILG
jgi:glycosyltransferase involved in cell wall biosynthesis